MITRPFIIFLLATQLGNWFSPVFYVGSLIMALDMRARWGEYSRFKDYQYSLSLLNYFKSSWCSRGVALTIWGSRAKDYYHSLGYRWYHILPDGTPKVFLQLNFWRGVLGI